MKLRGNITIPTNLETILTEITKKEDDIETNAENYLRQNIIRRVDVLMMCVLYGIYKFRSLPDFNFVPPFSERYEFNVDISYEKNLIVHLLLALWIEENPIPNDTISLDYRTKFYDFMEQILDEEKFVKTIIPFYLNLADIDEHGEGSFITKLFNMQYLPYKKSSYSPESVIAEFISARDMFIT
jgi:hypothetical protein